MCDVVRLYDEHSGEMVYVVLLGCMMSIAVRWCGYLMSMKETGSTCGGLEATPPQLVFGLMMLCGSLGSV